MLVLEDVAIFRIEAELERKMAPSWSIWEGLTEASVSMLSLSASWVTRSERRESVALLLGIDVMSSFAWAGTASG